MKIKPNLTVEVGTNLCIINFDKFWKNKSRRHLNTTLIQRTTNNHKNTRKTLKKLVPRSHTIPNSICHTYKEVTIS